MKKVVFIVLIEAVLVFLVFYLVYGIIKNNGVADKIKNAAAEVFESRKPEKNTSDSVKDGGISDEGKAGDDFKNTEKFSKEVLELAKKINSPEDEDKYIEMGNTAQYRRDFEKSLLYYDAVTAANSSNARAYSNRAVAKMELNDYQGAVRDCTVSINLAPENFSAYYNRAFAYQGIGEYEKALEDIDVALKNGYTEHGQTYSLKVIILSKMGDYASAIEACNLAMGSAPEKQKNAMYYSRANLKRNAGDYEGALEDYNKTIVFFPRLSKAYRERSEVKKILGDSSGAQEDYNKFEELSKNKKRSS